MYSMLTLSISVIFKKINADDDIRLKTLSLQSPINDGISKRRRYVSNSSHIMFEEYGVTFDEKASDMANCTINW